jgi:phytanoyl-CoA hydroxylase
VSRTIQSQFNKTGYALEKGVFSDGEIETLENEFDQIVTQLKKSGENINARWDSDLTRHIEDSDSEVIHTHNIQSYSSVMLNMVQNESLLDLAESLMGPDIILHHTKLFCKPPKKGSAFPLHQDWSYFPTQKNSMIAAVVHLSKSTEDMGCFRVVPESHKLGKIENSDGHSHVPGIHDHYSLETALPIEAEKGGVLFFHCCTIHGSMPNTSDHSRKTILIQLYSGKDTIVDENPHTNVQLVLRGWNYQATRESIGNIKS